VLATTFFSGQGASSRRQRSEFSPELLPLACDIVPSGDSFPEPPLYSRPGPIISAGNRFFPLLFMGVDLPITKWSPLCRKRLFHPLLRNGHGTFFPAGQDGLPNARSLRLFRWLVQTSFFTLIHIDQTLLFFLKVNDVPPGPLLPGRQVSTLFSFTPKGLSSRIKSLDSSPPLEKVSLLILFLRRSAYALPLKRPKTLFSLFQPCVASFFFPPYHYWQVPLS